MIGGAKGSRTPDLLNAIQTRYQLRYNPINEFLIFCFREKEQPALQARFSP